MRVYRVETKEGNGMYGWQNHSVSLNCCPYYRCDTYGRHPSPFRDNIFVSIATNLGISLNELIGSHHFGFVTIESVKNWLYDDRILMWLHERGYQISVYEGDKIYHGERQALFAKNECQLVESIKLADLIENFNVFEKAVKRNKTVINFFNKLRKYNNQNYVWLYDGIDVSDMILYISRGEDSVSLVDIDYIKSTIVMYDESVDIGSARSIIKNIRSRLVIAKRVKV